jgi:catechol 2,3-dioxygenase-like lactoylglutathione lyase family enzyme
MEHVGIVIDDLAAAIEFFVQLGLELKGKARSRAAGWTASWGSKVSGQISRCYRPRTATDDLS